MEKQLWGIALTAVGGIIATITSFFLGKKKNERTDFEIVIKTYKDLLQEHIQSKEKLEKKYEELNVLYGQITKKYDDLYIKLSLLENTHSDLPFPVWFKDTNGFILAMNKSYEDFFLKPLGKTAKDFIGTNDIDLFPENIADGDYISIDLNGEKIFYTKQLLSMKETSIQFRVIKYPKKIGNLVIGLAGIAIPESGFFKN